MHGTGRREKIGKRSQAVSAKKRLFWPPRWTRSRSMAFTARGLSRLPSWPGCRKPICSITTPRKKRCISRCCSRSAIWLAPLKAFREDISPLVAIGEYIRLKLEVSRDHPQASKLFCLEMLQGAPLLMGELTGDLKALVDEKSAIISGWVESGRLAPVDPQHLIFMIWATTQHYADFATQVEAVTGATLRDEAFFQQTVDNVQRMIIEGIRVR